MKNIGKTPLLRARNLEKYLGVKKIYLKLEGNNPKRSKFDRLAKTIVSIATSKNHQTIIADGDKLLIKSLNYLCEKQNLNLLIPMHKGEKWKINLYGEKAIDLIGVKKKNLPEVYNNLKQQNKAFLFAEEAIKNQLSVISFEDIANEIISRYENDIDNVFFYQDHTATKIAYSNAFLKANIDKKAKLPNLYEVNNLKETNLEKNNLISVDENSVKVAGQLLQKYEHLKIKEHDAIAFAGFLKHLKLEKIHEGRHIIILDTAKTKVSINQIEDFTTINKQELVDYVDNYLDRYSDSKTETVEAIEQAINKGYILTASSETAIDGVAIIVHMGFNQFIPTYHLAYIGINPKSKGRGLGSELIKEAINLTNGKLSLHVDLDNKNAKKLYRKMGFKHAYDRMIYQNDEI